MARKNKFSTDNLDPERAGRRQRHLRFKRVPINFLLPNAVTLLGLCAGVTAIRFAFEGRFDDAVSAILLAAILDGLDGRIARMLRGTSRFGAELDSLADFVSFGVAPAIILYAWTLSGLGAIGWIVAMVFAVCGALRLARFNVASEDPDKPTWTARFFVGVPAPAGALVSLLPLYLWLLEIPVPPGGATMTLIFTAAIAVLMVSRLPTFSGKMLGLRVRRDLVLPGLVIFAAFAAVLASYTWVTLAVGSVLYLLAIPFAIARQRQYATGRRVSKDDKPAEPEPEPEPEDGTDAQSVKSGDGDSI